MFPQIDPFHAVVILGLAILTVAGCGEARPTGVELAEVSGQITLNGQPLSKAVVRFQPTSGAGTYSAAVTDADGTYSLRFNRRFDGAIVGSHRVIITTGDESAEDDLGRPSPASEILPAVYHRESKLIRDVNSGENEIDFALSTTGESLR